MRRHRMRHASFLAALLVCLCGLGLAQKRDPLNEKEVDEMRETADWPDKRLETMAKFARARITAIDELQANGKTAKDRPLQIHDLLEDFTALIDEIEDNVEMYASHRADMRKGLTLVVEASSEWQLKLRRLKEQSPPEELDQYAFILTNATEAVGDLGEDTRKELQEQNELKKQNKLTKIYSERKD